MATGEQEESRAADSQRGADVGDRRLPVLVQRQRVEDQLATGCGCVALLLKTTQPDPEPVQVLGDVDQLLQAAARPVQFPNDQDVAPAQVSQGIGKARPVGLRPGPRVSKNLLAASSGEGILMEREVLVLG